MSIEWTAPLLWTLLLVVLMVATGPWTRRHYRLTTPAVTPLLRRVFVLLRSLAIISLLLAALGPVLVFERNIAEPAVVRVLLEDSRSMEMGDGGEGRSRWDVALDLVAAVDSVLSGRGEDAVLEVFRGNGIEPVGTLINRDVRPAAVGTSLPGLLRDGAGSEQARLTVLVADGHQTATSAVQSTRNGALAVVGVGDPVGPPDVQMLAPRTPDIVQVGDDIVVEIELELRGWGDRPLTELTVVLENDGREVGRRTVQPGAGDASVRCEIIDVPDAAGLRLLTARVLPVPGEAMTANNEAAAAVLVREGRRSILLLTSHPGWFVRFLAVSADAEDGVDLVVVGPTATGPAFEDGTPWLTPAGLAGWSIWDGLVLADPGAEAWVEPEPLVAAVAGGLGVLFVADPQTSSRPSALDDLRPVASVAGSPAGRWRVGVAPAEAGHPLLAGLPDLARGLQRRPPLASIVRAEPDAVAHTILEARAENSGADPLPLLVARRLDDGRTAWLGSPDLWEQLFWKPPQGLEEADYGLGDVMANLLIWIARGAEETGVMMLGRRHVYHEGETIEIRARRLDLGGRPGVPPSTLGIRSLDSESSFRPVRLSMRPVAGDAWTARTEVGPLPPGRYELTPLSAGVDEAAGAAREIIVTKTSVEDRQGNQDRTGLHTLASHLGGAYLDAGTVAGRRSLLRTVSELDLAPGRRTSRSSALPWSSWPFVTAVAVLLGLEWILRRRSGLL